MEGAVQKAEITFEDVAERKVGKRESEVFTLNSTDSQNIIAVLKWKGGRERRKS